MNQSILETSLAVFLAALLLSHPVSAQNTIPVTQDIAVSTTWTADHVYDLQTQIYVLPGATLTIEAGTVIASTTNGGGSLAVAKGAQIFVNGTKTRPVIMTSAADMATWTNGDPTTGTWREAANEWGNLTLMGDAYISENATVGNTPVPSASNVAAMEGLVASFPGDTKVLYGGGNDDDDSGSISYLSIRYGGKVIGLNNELNGLSMGGIGRGTDVHHVEIMNNVDDGIETWGGTVNYKYISVWNVGDDSFDIDQGWRGKAQFILLVQGYSLDAAQGSGVGDNCFETDGAEDSDWQPVTTATIYNCTVIGNPGDGDGLTAWRDNARIQYRNGIFMDGGEKVVRFDNVDGDGANGYGHNGTLSWAATWTTPYSTTSSVNAPANPSSFYQAQTSGMLAEMTDSVFYNNLAGNAYTEAMARGVFSPGNNNIMEPANSPITSIVRGTPVIKGGKVVVPVTFLDPRPANDALVSVNTAPNDGFFTPANYRGAFAPGHNWLCGWTASEAYGFTAPASPVAGPGQPGVDGAAILDINNSHNGNCSPVGSVSDPNGPFYTTAPTGTTIDMTIAGEPNQPIILFASTGLNPGLQSFANGIGQFDIGTGIDAATGFPTGLFIVGNGTVPDFLNAFFTTGSTGTMNLSLPGVLSPGSEFSFQAVIFNSATVVRFTNAVDVIVD